jgi:hypothetical protein
VALPVIGAAVTAAFGLLGVAVIGVIGFIGIKN